MKIAVFGAGAVGGYYGGRLAQAGENVHFIARGEHLRAMQAGGLRVESIKGDFSLQPVQATDDPAAIGPVDIVLVGVKAWQAPQAARSMQPLLGPETGVIYLGNGVEAPDQLARVLGKQHVLGGLTRISAALAGPGLVRHVGIEPYIAFGELEGGPSPRVEALRQAFERAQGVTASVPDDIQAAMWDKFVFIAAISGVGAITRAPAGVMRSLSETRALLEAALAEVVAVAHARQVNLPDNTVAKTMAFIDGMAPGVTASMQRDVMEGRPSELAAQSGAVARLGQAAGVLTPIHSFIYAALLPQELKARGEIQYG